MDISLSFSLRLLMKKSNWFGYLIYATSLHQLETKWEHCKTLETEFESLKYHQQYYELTKKRLQHESEKNSSRSSRSSRTSHTSRSSRSSHTSRTSSKSKTKTKIILRKVKKAKK